MSGSTGCRMLSVVDPAQGAPLSVVLLYPTLAAAQPVSFGAYAIELAMDAPMAGEKLSAVLISHGSGGTAWAYIDLAKHLVQAGFVVVMPEHTGNHRSDNTLHRTAANLANRPRHLSLALDAAFRDAEMRAHLASERVAVIGHSVGAYTGLAAAGARAWAAPHETGSGRAEPVPVAVDPRVASLVLLAPALFWFVEESFADVRLPVRIFCGELDTVTPPTHGELVQRAMGGVENTVVPRAGHYSFLSVFPPALVRPEFAPSQDPIGFDRRAAQPWLFAEIVAFIERTLPRS